MMLRLNTNLLFEKAGQAVFYNVESIGGTHIEATQHLTVTTSMVKPQCGQIGARLRSALTVVMNAAKRSRQTDSFVYQV